MRTTHVMSVVTALLAIAVAIYGGDPLWMGLSALFWGALAIREDFINRRSDRPA